MFSKRATDIEYQTLHSAWIKFTKLVEKDKYIKNAYEKNEKLKGLPRLYLQGTKKLFYNIIYTPSLDLLADDTIFQSKLRSIQGDKIMTAIKNYNIFVAVTNVTSEFNFDVHPPTPPPLPAINGAFFTVSYVSWENREILDHFAKRSTFKDYIRSELEINKDCNVLDLTKKKPEYDTFFLNIHRVTMK